MRREVWLLRRRDFIRQNGVGLGRVVLLELDLQAADEIQEEIVFNAYTTVGHLIWRSHVSLKR